MAQIFDGLDKLCRGSTEFLYIGEVNFEEPVQVDSELELLNGLADVQPSF